MSPPRAAARRTSDPALLLVLALALALRLALVLQPLAALDGYVVHDDTYLTLQLARNLAHGLGPWYGLGWTNGFQPLHTVLLVPVFWLVPHDPVLPVRLDMLLVVAADLGTLALLWGWLARTATTRLAPLAAGLAWATSPLVMQTAVNGLETSLATCALVAVFVARHRLALRGPEGWSARRLARLGALIALAGLARIDTLAAAPVIAWTLLGGADARALPLATRVRALALVAAVALALYAPWPLVGWTLTGDVIPVSGRAVRNLSLLDAGFRADWTHLYRPTLARAADVVARRQTVLLALVTLLAALLPFAGRPHDGRSLAERSRPFAPLALTVTLMLLAYLGWVFGAWYFNRYLFPLTLPLVLALAVLVDHHAEALTREPARRAAAAVVLAALVVGHVIHPTFARGFRYGSGRWAGYMNAGLWARAHIPAGTRVGALQSGAVAYFADSLEVVNLDGVVNNAAYRALRQHRPMAYLREHRIGWLFGWPDDPAFFVAQDPGARRDQFQPVATASGIASWGEPWVLFRILPADSATAR